MPVASNAVPVPLAGNDTTSGPAAGWARPLPSYKVDACVWLFATHENEIGPKATPHGFTRPASVTAAPTPEVSDTRLVDEKAVGPATASDAEPLLLPLYVPPEQLNV